MNKWLNLYTFLIDINSKFVFGEYIQDEMRRGNITVNGCMPEDINMSLKENDLVQVCQNGYVITESMMK
jgi:hypothetical protein